MINLEIKFNDAFEKEYIEYCLENFVRDGLKKVKDLIEDTNTKNKFTSFFTETKIKKIITCPHENLENLIGNVIGEFPILAERYCYFYLLRESYTPKSAKLKNKQLLKSEINKTIFELNFIVKKFETNQSELTVTKHYLLQLRESTVSLKEKGKILKALNNFLNEKSQISKKHSSLFPDWIDAFSHIFDFDKVASKFGYDLTANADLSICPYCGLEQIPTIKSGTLKIRPALDHFHPKSSFPFLAISLFNLVPSGEICNKLLKGKSSMLGFSHPCSELGRDQQIFNFHYESNTSIKDTLKITVNKLNNAKDKNLQLFKIGSLYNENREQRSWYCQANDVINWHKENGDALASSNISTLILRRLVDLSEPARRVTAQRFKVEAISNILGIKFQIVK